MAQSGATTASEWKYKYLGALEKQEKQEQQFQQLSALLARAIKRLSTIAEGIDPVLDKQLKGLRALLAEERLSRKDLDTLVSALDGQAKRVEDVKGQRAKALRKAFAALVDQLRALKLTAELNSSLKSYQGGLKSRVQSVQQYEPLVTELVELQKDVFAQLQQGQGGNSFWQGLFGRKEADAATEKEAKAKIEEDSIPVMEGEFLPAEEKPAGRRKVPKAPEWMAEAPELVDPRPELDHIDREPPFSRLNKAICLVLKELLDEVGPSDSALENYQTANKQIEHGLNWFELVPTLEDISLVVLAAMERDQDEFAAYLAQLNERLHGAHNILAASQQANEQNKEANQQLKQSMQQQMTAMKDSMASATELEQLKGEVSEQLDKIAAVMDQFHGAEEDNQQTLAEQLDSLVVRVKEMEQQSVEAEARIEEQRQRALRDTLTQLPNREAYTQRVHQEQERWQRYDRPLSMVVCDIDHFKRINDTYGHKAGDKVIRIIARTLAKRLRNTDFIARIGGEEFVVLMPETTSEQALSVAEKVREAIAACSFKFKDEPVNITMSFGITGFAGDDTEDTAFERADKALYKAKEGGRNQCCQA